MAFNPNEHLMQLQKKDYLEVKWRLVWFRDLCPTGSIETEIVHLDLDREVTAEVKVWNDATRKMEKVLKTAKGYCVCRAVIKDGNGGVGTGTKSEAAVDFNDFIEKAESGAIGRALATLGYGTQFTGDELDEKARIVDSPVDRSAHATTQEGSKPAQAAPKPQASESKPAEQSATTKLTAQSVYKAGKEKGLWNAANGFYAFATHVIGGNVNEATVKNIAAPNLEKLMKAVEAEKSLAKAS